MMVDFENMTPEQIDKIGIEPAAFGPVSPNEMMAQHSLAISAKRQADALERIAKSLERLAGAEYRGAILTHRRGA